MKFSKELTDALLRSSMRAVEKVIVLAVARATFGDGNRSQAPISVGSLVACTGLDRHNLQRALAELLEQGVLAEVKPASFGSARVLAIVKDYEAWGKFSVCPDAIPNFRRHDWEVAAEDRQAAEDHQAAGDTARGGAQPPQQAALSRPSKEREKELSLSGARKPRAGGGRGRAAKAAPPLMVDGQPVDEYDSYLRDDPRPEVRAAWLERYGASTH